MTSPAPVPSYRALLAVPTLGRIVLGMALARIGVGMLGVALVLFTLDRYGSPELAGVVTLANLGPGLLVSPVAGALLDRHGRARLVILDQIIAAGALVLVAILAAADALPASLLIVIAAVAGITSPLSTAGLRSLFPLIVPRHLWERVNAVDSNGYVLATLVGPPAAGILVQFLGGPATLVAIAVLFALAAVVFVGIADPRNPAASTGRLLVDSWQGLCYTLRNPTLRALGATIAVLNLGGGVQTIVVPLIVLRGLGEGEAVVGLVWAVSGVFGGLGALLAGRWRTAGRERTMLVLPTLGIALGWAILLLPPSLPLLALAMAVTGFMNGPMDVALFTLRQRRTDPAWTGRAFAVSMSLNFAGFPIGSAFAGVLVGAGLDVAVAFAVLACLAAATLGRLLIPASGVEVFPSARLPDPAGPGTAVARD